MTSVEIVGYLATGLTVLSGVPQAVKTWKTKDVESFSTSALIFIFLGQATWTIYGFMMKAAPMILVSMLMLIGVLIMIFMKLDGYVRNKKLTQ